MTLTQLTCKYNFNSLDTADVAECLHTLQSSCSSSFFVSLYNVHVCDINGKKIMLFKGMLEERVKNV